MQPGYLLDTNICIYIRGRQLPQVMTRFDQLSPGEATISVVTYGELLFGAEKSVNRTRNMKLIQDLISVIPVRAMTDAVAHAYASLRAKLEIKGEMIGNNDLWIAAHAVASGLILVTNNEREYRRVPGLTVENWVM